MIRTSAAFLTVVVFVVLLIGFGLFAWRTLAFAQPTPARFSSVQQAAVHDPSQIAELVAEKGSPEGGHDRMDEHSPLWYAVRFDKPESVAKLLALGADPNRATEEGESPLLTATFLGTSTADTEIVQMLLKAKADVNVRGPVHGQTPLHRAVVSENEAVVRMLIDHGANVNQVDVRGNTPLQTAVVNGSIPILELLFEAKADPEIRNEAGFRPIDQLNSCSNPEEVQAVFRKHDADSERRPPVKSND